jgi:PAS domain S-box-containing protein
MENKKLKILAIDDNQDNLTSVKALIREAFPQALVLTATDAGKGIEQAQVENPDAILLDVVMPGMDGFEACQQLKANPLTRHIPVVFLTAIKGDREARIRALEVGAEAFLSKPIDEVELTAQIRAMQKIKAASEHERDEKKNLTELVVARTRELELAHTAALNVLEDLRKENTAREESEARFRLLFENLPSGVVVHAADTAVLFANPEALRLLGLTLDQMRGKTATDPAWCFLREDGGSLALEDYPVNRVRSSGKALAGQIMGIRLPGQSEPNWGQCSAYPQLDASGQISQVIVAFTDITVRKQAEMELRESRELVESVVENIPLMIFLKEATDLRFVKFNRAGENLLGYDRRDFLGKNDFDIFPPEQAALFTDKDREVLAGDTDVLDIPEEAIQTARQGERLLHTRKVCIRGGDGKTKYLLGISEDITERRRAEAERLRLSMAIEQTNDAVVVTDHEGAIQYVNPAFERVTGYSRQDALGRNPRLLKSGKQDAAFYRRMWATLAAGKTWNGRMINKHKDGTFYEEDASISPILDGLGKIVNYVAVKRDVTREHQLEEQLQQAQKMESVGRLAGGVAHDFNNLLMGIMGYTELCREKVEAGHPIQEYLTEIVSGAQRSAEITRQLLAFARKQTIAPIALDLNDAVAGMLKLLRRLIGEDIKMTWKPGADLRLVKLDPSQVDQILANLCVNARDAIGGVGEVVLETGSITVDAESRAIHPEAIPGTYSILAVSDNGCGMDKATLARIFEPFFTTKGVGKGTGLGLATVYGIVKQNNGFINVYSEPGKGTTFRIHLPVITDENVETTVTGNPEVTRGQGETILLVEDDASVRTTCGLFLLASNYKVLTAESPEQALVIAGRTTGDIQLLLTDVVMPGMDGRQLAKRIREDRPGIKVLFMSGYTADLIAKRGVLDEGVQFISKPFSRGALTRKLRHVLENTSEQAFMQDPSDSTVPGASI